VTVRATERIPNFIDGAWAPSSGTEHLEVRDPGIAELRALTPLSTGADVDLAVHAAARAFPAWRATPPVERARACSSG